MEVPAFQNKITCGMYDELLDGRIAAMSPRPMVNHNIVAENIISLFKNHLRGKQCKVFGELDVFLTGKDRVIPDAMVVCNRDIIKYNGIHGVPDLIIEVLSPSTAKNDKGYKKKLYEQCGVKEYWIVDTDSRSIDVYLLENGTFELDNVYAVYPDYFIESMNGEEKAAIIYQFTVSLFPDLSIVIENVFEGMI